MTDVETGVASVKKKYSKEQQKSGRSLLWMRKRNGLKMDPKMCHTAPDEFSVWSRLI